MNPELPQVRQNVEAPPQIPGGIERSPEQATQTPEIQTGVEAGPDPGVAQQKPVIPTVLPVVTVSQPVQDDTQTVASDDDTPLTARTKILLKKNGLKN